MTQEVALDAKAKTHLEGLAQETVSLLGHAQPDLTDKPPTCWTKNSEEIDVALTVLRAAAASINDAVTRFNLVFKGNPGDAASESMARELAGFCQKMVSSLTLLRSVGASGPMVGYYSGGVRGVLHSIKDVVAALLDPARHTQINALTGVVWEACKDIQQAPSTNKLACRRQMMQWSVAVKDTIEEFQEAAKAATAAAAQGTSKSSHADEDTGGLGQALEDLKIDPEGPDGDFDFDMTDDYSPSELRCVDATIDVLRFFRRCLKAANDSLNTLDSGGASSSGKAPPPDFKRELAWAHSLLGCLSKANESTSELGVLLYPPLDASELSGRSEDVGRALSEFCDIFCAREGLAGSGCGKAASLAEAGPSPLRASLEEKLSSLRESISQMQDSHS